MGRKPKSAESYADYTLWPVVSRFIRLRDCLRTTGTFTHCLCFTCLKKQTFEQIEAGHYRPAGNNNTRFNQNNIQGQCSVCNDFRKGNGMRPVFRINLIALYGLKVVEDIEAWSRKPKKYTIEELQKVKKYYERGIDNLLKKG